MKQISKTMKKDLFLVLFLLVAPALAFATSPDSLRTEAKEGKTFVVHKVEPGQTLYAVMRKYKTTIQALKDANPGMNENLVTGQTVRVPKSGAASTPPKILLPKEPQKEIVKVEPKPELKPKAIEKIIIKPQPPVEEEKIVIAPQKPIEETPKKKIEEEKIVIAPQKPVEETPKKVVVEVPKKVEEKEKEAEPKADFVLSKTGVHKVEGRQSLYGIAVKYGVLMSDVRRWNNLGNDQLRTGQEIIVSENAYNEYLKKSKSDSVRLTETKPAEKISLPMPIPAPSENGNLPEPKIANTGKRIIENGMAEVIDAMDNGNKYLALHRTAPVGSLIQVKNVSNSQSIWVKVVGKLPSISVNDRIIIKLSARAQEKLSPSGRRFLSEISYLNN